MRIAYITHYAALYGANRSLLDLVLALRERSAVRPVVVLPAPGALSEALEQARIPWTAMPMEPWMHVPFRMGGPHHRLRQSWREHRTAVRHRRHNMALWPRLQAWLMAQEVELVHLNSATVGIAPQLLAAGRLPVVWHLRELLAEHYGLLPDRGWKDYGSTLCQARHLIVVSAAVERAVRALAGPDVPVSVIANGVMPRQRMADLAARHAARPANDRYTLVLPALFHPSKGQMEAVLAMDLLRQQCPAVRLVLAGGGRIEAVRALVAQHGLEPWVELRPFTPEPLELLVGADALLMPSRHEAFGRVTAEAMACGLPVVAHASGGTPELVAHECTGLLYTGGEAELAACLLRLATDPALGAALGAAAQQRATARWALEDMADSVLAVYRQVLPQP